MFSKLNISVELMDACMCIVTYTENVCILKIIKNKSSNNKISVKK